MAIVIERHVPAVYLNTKENKTKRTRRMTWVGDSHAQAQATSTLTQRTRRMSLGGTTATQTRTQDVEAPRRLSRVGALPLARPVETEPAPILEEVEVEIEVDEELQVKGIEKREKGAEDATGAPVLVYAFAKSRSMMNRNAAANPGASLYVAVSSYRG